MGKYVFNCCFLLFRMVGESPTELIACMSWLNLSRIVNIIALGLQVYWVSWAVLGGLFVLLMVCGFMM
jgi:hypothetical protein